MRQCKFGSQLMERRTTIVLAGLGTSFCYRFLVPIIDEASEHRSGQVSEEENQGWTSCCQRGTVGEQDPVIPTSVAAQIGSLMSMVPFVCNLPVVQDADRMDEREAERDCLDATPAHECMHL